MLPIEQLPSSLFWGNVSGVNYLTVNRNQHIPQYCGACWAFAATSAMSDRIKIMRNATWPDVNLAPQVLVSCDSESEGCAGGDPNSAYAYIHDHGITDETCSLYQARGYTNGKPCSAEAVCMNCATNGTCFAQDSYYLYSVDDYGTLSGEQKMMNELLDGPIACAIDATPQFDNYTHGIFNDTTGATDLNHIVSLVGWGVQKGVKYWIGRNSWGRYWGEDGFFRIVRGTNNLGIEEYCAWAMPKPGAVHVQGKGTTVRHQLESVPRKTLETQDDSSPTEYFAQANVAVPAAWDWRNVTGRNFLSWSRNQHIPQYCGACWAFAATSAISDRFNILRNNSFPQLSLSPQVMINCAAGGSCSAGDPWGVYKFGNITGIPDDTCQQYVASDPPNDDFACSPIQNCMTCSPPAPAEGKDSQCSPVLNFTRYFVSQYGLVKGADAMKQQIYLYGPISCGMCVTPEFDAYKGGIFSQKLAKPEINHQVSLVGWGQEGNVSYWIGRNQWGTYWGEQGFFRIQMGSDNLAIETECDWGYAAYAKR